MPSIGTKKRTNPRIRVLRGYDPQNPSAPSRTAPVKSGVTIKSGQVVSLEWNADEERYEWTLGWQAGRKPYIAYGESTDPDVIDAEALKALDFSVPAVLQTAFYKAGDTYNEDTALSPDGVTGNVCAATPESGVPIIGYVREIRGPYNVASGSGPEVGGSNLPEDSSAAVAGSNVIRFATAFLPNLADAV